MNNFKDNKYYKDLIYEFNLKVENYNNNILKLINDENVKIILNFKLNRTDVFINTKYNATSSFASLNSNTKNEINYDAQFMFAEMLAIDLVWRYNYDKTLIVDEFPHYSIFIDIKEKNPEKLKRILKDTNLTIDDVVNGAFGTAIDKYTILKNLINEDLYYLTILKYIPTSLKQGLSDNDILNLKYVLM
jgi:hypothetical protein